MAIRRLFDGATIEIYQIPIEAPVSGTIVWIKVSGVWKQATPFIKVSGVWKQSTPYIKVSGTWK
jgi:hypothetical protein